MYFDFPSVFCKVYRKIKYIGQLFKFHLFVYSLISLSFNNNVTLLIKCRTNYRTVKISLQITERSDIILTCNYDMTRLRLSLDYDMGVMTTTIV